MNKLRWMIALVVIILFSSIFLIVLFPIKASLEIKSICIKPIENTYDMFIRTRLAETYGADEVTIEKNYKDIKKIEIKCNIKNLSFKTIILPHLKFSNEQKLPHEIIGNRFNTHHEGTYPIPFMNSAELTFDILVCCNNDSEQEIFKKIENVDICVIDYTKPYYEYFECKELSKKVKLMSFGDVH